MEIKMLSGERNKLIRILENYKIYLEKDKNLKADYKNMELKDIILIHNRLMGQVPVENYRVAKSVDPSVFGCKGDY